MTGAQRSQAAEQPGKAEGADAGHLLAVFVTAAPAAFCTDQ